MDAVLNEHWMSYGAVFRGHGCIEKFHVKIASRRIEATYEASTRNGTPGRREENIVAWHSGMRTACRRLSYEV